MVVSLFLQLCNTEARNGISLHDCNEIRFSFLSLFVLRLFHGVLVTSTGSRTRNSTTSVSVLGNTSIATMVSGML